MEGNILRLTVKKRWFDLIASGEKKEEYREVKPYWFERLVFEHNKVFAYCTGYTYKSRLFRNEGVDHICRNKQSMFGFKPFDFVEIKNGYSKNAPTVLVECKGIEIGKPISGLCEEGWLDTDLYRIKLGNIITLTSANDGSK